MIYFKQYLIESFLVEDPNNGFALLGVRLGFTLLPCVGVIVLNKVGVAWFTLEICKLFGIPVVFPLILFKF